MKTISQESYNKIHTDYRGVWSNTNWPEYIGKRTVLTNSLNHAIGLPLESGTSLEIEGISFQITA